MLHFKLIQRLRWHQWHSFETSILQKPKLLLSRLTCKLHMASFATTLLLWRRLGTSSHLLAPLRVTQSQPIQSQQCLQMLVFTRYPFLLIRWSIQPQCWQRYIPLIWTSSTALSIPWRFQPMRPWRMRLTTHLCQSYLLQRLGVTYFARTKWRTLCLSSWIPRLSRSLPS